MAESPKSIRVKNPEMAAEIIRAGQQLIDIGMGLRDVGFEVPIEYTLPADTTKEQNA